MPKGNTDYTKSAVNLCNPKEVEEELAFLHKKKDALEKVEAEIEILIPAKLKQTRDEIRRQIAETERGIRPIIDKCGSFQDLVRGWYGVKQKRENTLYSPILVRQQLPVALAQMVIEETVNNKKMSGLVEGGLVTKDQAKKCGVASDDFAYIIR